MGTSGQPRRRNRWGDGARLREDIVRSARLILEREGAETAVTLRAVAREAGITAPAIYAHFPDRESMVAAAIAEAYQEFLEAIDVEVQGLAGGLGPVSRLRAFCLAYLHYAQRRPATYQVLFARSNPSALPEVAAMAAGAFAELVEILAACAPVPRSKAGAFPDAVLLWAGLHGLATLPAHHPRFPWPDLDGLVGGLIRAHAHVEPAALAPVHPLPTLS